MDEILNEELEEVVDGAEATEEIDSEMMVDTIIEPTYKVYAKVDEQSRIVAVNSSMWLTEEEIERDGWVLIDEGTEYPRYPHAQGNYFSDGIYTEDGFPKYKLEASEEGEYTFVVVERTEEEIQSDRDAVVAVTPNPSGSESVWDEMANAIEEGVNEV